MNEKRRYLVLTAIARNGLRYWPGSFAALDEAEADVLAAKGRIDPFPLPEPAVPPPAEPTNIREGSRAESPSGTAGALEGAGPQTTGADDASGTVDGAAAGAGNPEGGAGEPSGTNDAAEPKPAGKAKAGKAKAGADEASDG